jgi:predicted acyltransferase
MIFNKRVPSVDIFRGATILLMILVNTPGTWSAVYAPFLHASWHGYTLTDLVFPFFLFIVGVSISLSYKDKKLKPQVFFKLTKRSLKLIALGLFLGAFTISFPFIKDFDSIRFPGVLQRIGLVFFFASILYLWGSKRSTTLIIGIILLVYWLWMGYLPLDGVAPTYERGANNWANFIDLKLLGPHMWQPDYDPEGILSTLPAIATALLGTLAGDILRSNTYQKASLLFLSGLVLLGLGHLLDLSFPINKALWSSSFVLVTAGWANLVLGTLFYLREVKKCSFGGVFSKVGANAIAIYFTSSFITKLFYLIPFNESSIHGALFETIYLHQGIDPALSSLLYAITVCAFYVLMASFMYQKKIFIKV